MLLLASLIVVCGWYLCVAGGLLRVYCLDLLGVCAHTSGRLLVFGGLFVAFGLR